MVEDAVLQVKVSEITEEGLQLDVTETSWFPDREVAGWKNLRTEVALTRSGDRIVASGTVTVDLLLTCDRCLEEFELPNSTDFQLVLALGEEDPALTEREHEFGSDEADVIYLEEPVIDIGSMLYQQVVLSLPQKRVCRLDCRGLCSKCGADLNKEQCVCLEDNGGSPFGVLGRLIKDKN